MIVLNFFGIRLTLRLIVMIAAGLTLAFFLPQPGMYFTKFSLTVLLVLAIADIHRFLWKMNRRYSRFFDLLKYGEYDGAVAEGLPGNIGRWVKTVMLDTKDRIKNREESLLKKQQILNLSFDLLNEGVIVLNTEGEILLTNKAFQSLSAREREQIHQHFRVWKDISTVETEISGDEGLILNLRIQTLKTESEKLVIGLVSTKEDSQQSHSSIENYIRVMGHELRNGITPILSISSSLEEMVESESTLEFNQKSLKKGVKTIHSQAQKMMAISERYQSFMQITPPVKEKIKVEKLREGVLSIIPDSVNATFETGNCKWIDVDLGQIFQIFENLINNSVKALNGIQEPTISIRLEQENLHNLIHFTDNGRGIPESEIAKVFDPFVSLDKDGTGIGLSLCRKIVWMHGGKMNVLSSSSNGTSFIIRLPM